MAVLLLSAVVFLPSGGCSFRLGRLCGGAFTVCCGVSALCWFGRFPGIFDLLCGSLFLHPKSNLKIQDKSNLSSNQDFILIKFYR